ncbi:MAG: gliding motility lipoprotein GldH [Marinifilaceae bacterium]
MRNYILLLCVLVSCVCVSCQPKSVYHNYLAMDDEQWTRDIVPEFTVVIEENGYYNINLLMRHTTDYPMSNLWCFVDILRKGETVKRDTVSVHVAQQDGRWLGTGGAIKTIVQALDDTKIWLPADTLTVKITQAMRTSPLYGVRDIGIEID